MNKLITLLTISLLLLSCQKEYNSPLVVEELKAKPTVYPYAYQINETKYNVCSSENMQLIGLVHYKGTSSQTPALYTNTYEASYDSVTAVGTVTGRVYKVAGIETIYSEATVDGDQLTLSKRDSYKKLSFKTTNGHNDLTSTYESHLNMAPSTIDVCK